MGSAALKFVAGDWSSGNITSVMDAVVAPWSSVAEKLAGIELLTENRNQAGLDILKQAVQLLGLNRPIRPLAPPQGVARGGEVAGAAARAIATYHRLGGLEILEDLIVKSEHSLILRETAAYGLGACSAPAIYSIYARCLLVTEPDLRYRVLLSLRESLHRSSDVDRPEVVAVILQVQLLLARRMRDLQGGELELVISLISRFGSVEAEQSIGELLVSSSDVGVVRACVDVLRRRQSQTAKLWLLRAFIQTDRPAELYPVLAEELSQNMSAQVRNAALGIVRPHGISGLVRGIFSAQERRRRELHILAAESLLAG